MAFIETRDGTSLYYKDWGAGRPVVLIHGWPLSADMWEWQMPFLAEQGLRVVAYDRRGFGRSSQPWTGYDYDTFADDLAALLERLDLRDVVLVGFSMGGGEVARYLARHGSARIGKAALLGAVPPYLLKTPEHPQGGAPPELFAGMIEGIKADRPKFFEEFGKNFYGVGGARPVSEAILRWSQGLAMQASSRGTTECVRAFGHTDFRADMAAFTVPTLVAHGDADAIVPLEVSGRVAARMVPGAVLKVYAGAPHGFFCTHRDELNADLLEFARS